MTRMSTIHGTRSTANFAAARTSCERGQSLRWYASFAAKQEGSNFPLCSAGASVLPIDPAPPNP